MDLNDPYDTQPIATASVRVRVAQPFARARLLLTMQHEQILRHWTQNVESPQAILEVPLDPWLDTWRDAHCGRHRCVAPGRCAARRWAGRIGVLRRTQAADRAAPAASASAIDACRHMPRRARK
jgi:hypothetical protein